MITFSGFVFLKTCLKQQICYLYTNYWIKSTNFTIIILLKYNCTIMTERHEFGFSVILKNDFKQKRIIDKRYSMFYVTNTDCAKASE